jgi:hypothetical protein
MDAEMGEQTASNESADNPESNSAISSARGCVDCGIIQHVLSRVLAPPEGQVEPPLRSNPIERQGLAL